jgi:hypothetical protein
MKFQNMIRTQLVLAGFAAALLFAGSASAQEIENTAFYDGPTVAALEQAAVVQPTVVPNSMQANSTPVQSAAPTDTASLEVSLAEEDSLMPEDPTAAAWMDAILLTCIGLLCLAVAAGYALGKTKRAGDGFHSRRPYIAPRTA